MEEHQSFYLHEVFDSFTWSNSANKADKLDDSQASYTVFMRALAEHEDLIGVYIVL